MQDLFAAGVASFFATLALIAGITITNGLRHCFSRQDWFKKTALAFVVILALGAALFFRDGDVNFTSLVTITALIGWMARSLMELMLGYHNYPEYNELPRDDRKIDALRGFLPPEPALATRQTLLLTDGAAAARKAQQPDPQYDASGWLLPVDDRGRHNDQSV